MALVALHIPDQACKLVAHALFWQGYVWRHTHLSIFIFIIQCSGEDRQDSDERRGRHTEKGHGSDLNQGCCTTALFHVVV